MSPGIMNEKLNFTDFGNVINGVVTRTEKTLHGINPSTTELLYEAPVSTKKDVDDAVEAARRAFPSWSKWSWDERKKLMDAYAAAIDDHVEAFSTMMTKEQGKPLKWARLEALSASNWLRELIKQDMPKVVVYDNEKKYAESRYTPLGVVAGIVPWNFPMKIAMSKIAPALLTGNCIILKPSPFTPYCAIKLVELAQRFFPPGVLQVVSGRDDIGPFLTEHPGVDKVTFTGSSATGKRIMQSASLTLKKVTLELGGNDPTIILPDVDIAKVAPQIATYAFLNSGQICLAIKRVYIHEDIYDEFKDAMVNYAKTLQIGDGLTGDVFMGPLQNKMQYDRVLDIIEDCRSTKQTFALGGEPAAVGKGYFVNPTIIDRPSDDSRLVVEEPFGPIIPLMSWKDEADVISRANNSDMGLGASVWGKDVAKARHIGDQIQSGSVWINQHMVLDSQVAFSGHKASGFGVENGAWGLAGYCNIQSVFINHQAQV